jgi:hypothetical protein
MKRKISKQRKKEKNKNKRKNTFVSLLILYLYHNCIFQRQNSAQLQKQTMQLINHGNTHHIFIDWRRDD